MNVQLVPPGFGREAGNKALGNFNHGENNDIGNSSNQDWTVVREKNSEGKGQKKDSAILRQRKQSGSKPKNLGKGTVAEPRQNVGARRPPKSSAVMITGQSENFSYADAIKKAREGISLKDLQIERT